MPKDLPGLSIDMDAADGLFALGFADGMMTEINTTAFVSDILTHSHGVLSDEFDKSMDMHVQNTPQRFGHMYEWSSLSGSTPASGRLWSHVLKGRGKRREATFNFLISKQPIKTALERASDPKDPISNIPEDELTKLAEGGKKTYVFRQKARIMEYGLSVTITPRGNNSLFIPTAGTRRGFVFAKSVTTTPGTSEQRGAFTAQWVEWWSTTAPRIWDETVSPEVVKDIRSVESSIVRSRNKLVGLFTVNNASAAYIEGRNMAQSRLRGKAKSLAASRKYTRKYGEDLIIDG